MTRAGSQAPLKKRANQVGPRMDAGVGLSRPSSRSQTAYTSRASSGSAVIDSLSTATLVLWSRASAIGSSQLEPPSVVRLTRMAFVAPWSEILKDTLIWYAVPSGEKVTQGSLARS